MLYGWGATAIIGSKSAISLQRGPDDPTFLVGVEGVAPNQTFFFFSENHRLNNLSWWKKLDRRFFRFVTMHAFDRQRDGWMDRRTPLASLFRAGSPCSVEKYFFRSCQEQVASWCCGRVSDLRSRGRGVGSSSLRPASLRKNSGQFSHTRPMCLCHQAVYFGIGQGRWCLTAGKVTAGLAENNNEHVYSHSNADNTQHS